jgi:hypothetical protein
MESSQSQPVTQQSACERLACVVKALGTLHYSKLDKLKRNERQLNRPDFVWHFLVESFATMGSSRGYEGLILDPVNYSKVTFESLSLSSPADRLRILKETLHAAKVRMPDKKAEWLAENFDRIVAMAGPAAAKAGLLRNSTRESKIEFLEQFKGIGPKYARNILMIVYHPDFRQSIAVDERIKSVSRELGLSFGSYDEEEQFYVNVAARAGLNGWELDRLVYNFRNEVLTGLREMTAPTQSGS